MAGHYTVWLDDVFGNHLSLLEHFASMSLARATNANGALILRIPNLDASLTKIDGQIEVWRAIDDGPLQLVTETNWLIRRITKSHQGGEFLTELYAEPLINLLDRRIVPFPAGNAYTKKTAAADDMIKAIVREQMGTLVADSARSWSTYITVEADKSQGVSLSKEFANQSVLSACQDIAQSSAANGTPIFFDIVCLTPQSYAFRTYIGQRGIDHTQDTGQGLVTLSEDTETLADPSFSEDYSRSYNYVYGGAQSLSGLSQIIGTANDASLIRLSPFGRTEKWIDARMSTTQTSADYEAYTALRDGRPQRILDGRIMETDTCRYGIEWTWGDMVSAQMGTDIFNARIDSINININAERETIDARFRSVT